jgi:predicted esterase
VHGEADEALPPQLTAELVEELCAAGLAVEYHTYPATGHDAVLAASADDTARWLAGRVAGDDPRSTCAAT